MDTVVKCCSLLEVLALFNKLVHSPLVEFSRRRPKDNSRDSTTCRSPAKSIHFWKYGHRQYGLTPPTKFALALAGLKIVEKTELAVSNSPDFNWPEVQPADMASSAQTDWCGFCGQLCRLLGSCKLVTPDTVSRADCQCVLVTNTSVQFVGDKLERIQGMKFSQNA